MEGIMRQRVAIMLAVAICSGSSFCISRADDRVIGTPQPAKRIIKGHVVVTDEVGRGQSPKTGFGQKNKPPAIPSADTPALVSWNKRLDQELDTMLNNAIRSFYVHNKSETYSVTLDFTVNSDQYALDPTVVEYSPSGFSPKLPLMLLQTISLQKRYLLAFPPGFKHRSVRKRYRYSREFGPLT